MINSINQARNYISAINSPSDSTINPPVAQGIGQALEAAGELVQQFGAALDNAIDTALHDPSKLPQAFSNLQNAWGGVENMPGDIQQEIQKIDKTLHLDSSQQQMVSHALNQIALPLVGDVNELLWGLNSATEKASGGQVESFSGLLAGEGDGPKIFQKIVGSPSGDKEAQSVAGQLQDAGRELETIGGELVDPSN